MKINLPKLGNIEVVSVAGRKTSVHVPSYGAAFDLGTCSNEIANNAHHVFLTHGHLDHSAGVLEHFSARDLNGQNSTYYIPNSRKHVLNGLFETAMDLNGSNEEQGVVPKIYGAEAFMPVKLTNTVSIVPFPTEHRVDSCGYYSTRTKTVLKREFVGLSQKEIVATKSSGKEITETVSCVEFLYSGDTTMNGLLRHSAVLVSADYVAVECTYLGDSDSPETARNRGHIHLDELAEKAEELFEKTHTVVLMHFSAKYNRSRILQEVERKFPSSIAKKVVCVTDSH